MMTRPRPLPAACRLLLGALLLLSPPAVAAQPIDAATYFPASNFPQAQQQRLAAGLLGAKWLRDAEAEDYLRRTARQLAPEDTHFVIIAEQGEANAFAFLGGLVVVFRGLWDFAEEEDGFVGVLAHELAHVRLGHVQKTRENAERITALTLPLLLGGLLMKSDEARKAIIAGSAGVVSSEIVAYSRELEHEADIHALNLMLTARRDVQAMARLFSLFSGGGNPYHSTHPAPARRNAYLAQRAESAPPPAPSQDLEYALLRVKLARRGASLVERTYQKTRQAVLANAKSTGREKLLANYGLLLSANKTRNKALGAEAAAVLADEDNPLIARAVAESLRQRGMHAAALQLLREARAAHPQRLALLLQQFAVHASAQQHAEILALHRDLPSELRRHPQVHLAAGRAAARAGQQVRANHLLATGHALAGDFEQARKQIAVAERLDGGDVDTLLQLNELKGKVDHELHLLQSGTLLLPR